MRTSDAEGGEFIVVHPFMLRLGLPPLSVLVYARMHGFCKSGGEFYESRAATAAFLNRDPSQITKAVNRLLEAGLVVQTGLHTSRNGSVTRSYVTVVPPEFSSFSPDDSSPPTKPHPHDAPSRKTVLSPDKTSGEPVTGCHPIRKGIRKPYG